MTFSIVIPTFNGERFVEQAIKSVLNQTRSADEIIISDDNSNDSTIEICSKFFRNVKIFKNPNGPSGFVNGWNNAISHATGDYISILHQDDFLATTFLEEIEKAISLNPDVKHFFVPCNNIDENGEVFNQPDYCDGSIKRYNGTEYIHAYQTIGQPHIHRCPGVVTHRSIFEKCKYRTEAGHIADDDFFYRVGQYTDVVGILKTLASYRVHRFSETGHIDNLILEKRLLHDYVFQVEEMYHNTAMDKFAKRYFLYWKRTHLRRVLVRSIIHKDFQTTFYAIKCLFNYS